jgi:hypothetical protein
VKISKKVLGLLIVLCALVFLSGCVKPSVIACREAATLPTDKGGKFGWTEEQAMAACADVDRTLAGKFDETKGTWTIDYTKIITVEEALKHIQDQRGSIDVLLSYEDEETARDIDFWKGMRKGLERQEKRLRWIEQRLTYVINYNAFVDKVGESDGEIAKKLMPYGRKAYSLRLLYPIYDLKQLRFAADYVEAAKRDGSLKLINEFPIVEKEKFAEKVPDRDDPNKFSWKSHYRGWLIKAYKVMPDKERPVSPNIDYLEIFKAKFNKTGGNDEEFAGYDEQFAVAGFKSRGKDTVNLFVIDYDLEVIQGFCPDKVFETFVDVIFGNEIYINDDARKEVMEVLYEPPIAEEKEYRKKPQEKPLYVEIARMGEVTVSAWEEGEFSVPFSYSATGPGKFDLASEIIWAQLKTPEEKRVEEEEGLKKIEFFKLSYKKEGNAKVIEYYVPKPDYSQQDIKEGYALSDTFRIRRKGQPEMSADIKFFTDRIKAVDYEYGSCWYRLLDKDGDGKFEKRRKIADPMEKTNAVINIYSSY